MYKKQSKLQQIKRLLEINFKKWKWFIWCKKYSKHFRKEISQKEIVQFLVNTDDTLKTTYECYQGIINSLKEKDFNKFKLIVEHPSNFVSDKMK